MSRKRMTENDDNIIDLQEHLNQAKALPFLQTGGGKGGGEYLRKMKTGTWFTVQNTTGQMPTWMLRKLQHAGCKGKACLLYDDASGKIDFFWVDPDSWCRDWKLFEILEEPK